jgi:protein transport protein SEC31|tara:strand:- start:2160 stop:2381 length:222 start_codon:yes stop_codon:yes gene_type:complete
MAYQHPYVKQVNRCATVAFAPNAPFITTGTMAGAIDLSFSTTACLEVREFDRAHHLFPTSVRRPDLLVPRPPR